jgi:hypothetical protein
MGGGVVMSEIIIKVPEWFAIVIAVTGIIYSVDKLWGACEQVWKAWKKP